jgi:glucuronate isomerase
MGLISCFIGMLTRPRAFFIFSRHEWPDEFFCNLLGDEIKGSCQNDMEWIGKWCLILVTDNANSRNFNEDHI